MFFFLTTTKFFFIKYNNNYIHGLIYFFYHYHHLLGTYLRNLYSVTIVKLLSKRCIVYAPLNYQLQFLIKFFKVSCSLPFDSRFFREIFPQTVGYRVCINNTNFKPDKTENQKHKLNEFYDQLAKFQTPAFYHKLGNALKQWYFSQTIESRFGKLSSPFLRDVVSPGFSSFYCFNCARR